MSKLTLSRFKTQDIKALKPNSGKSVKIHDTMEVTRDDDGIVLMRYFSLGNTPKSWGIEAKKAVADWDSIDDTLTSLRDSIQTKYEELYENHDLESLHFFGRKYVA